MVHGTHSYKILLAEKEKTLGIIFKDLFEKAGFSTSLSRSESNIVSKINSHSFDLIIISQSFLKENKILEQIRSKQSSLPKVIILLNDRDTYLMMSYISEGVDNILWKPIHPKELLFRVKNTLRMTNHIDEEKIERDNLSLHLTKGVLIIDNASINLSVTEIFILQKLFQHGEKYLDLDALSTHICKNFSKSTDRNSTRVAISRLKGKIQEQSGYELIRNRRSRGYYLSL